MQTYYNFHLSNSQIFLATFYCYGSSLGGQQTLFKFADRPLGSSPVKHSIHENTKFICCLHFCVISLKAQPPQIGTYTVDDINLPAEMDKQVCISGMKFYNGKLYLASERCPSIFVIDPVKGALTQTINIQVPANFEMEGMTSYKDKLYLISENVAAIYEVSIPTGNIKTIQTSTPLPAKSKDGDGMEGIAANEKTINFTCCGKEMTICLNLKYIHSVLNLVMKLHRWC